jgi:pimeloyl-ACP methyl ester carboxylesterase
MLAARDRLIPKEVINDLKLIRPDDQITLLENVGHAPFMTQPETFLESLIPFINHYAG